MFSSGTMQWKKVSVSAGIFFALILCIVGGYAWGERKKGIVCKAEKESVQNELNDLKARLSVAFPAPEEVLSVSGMIQKIGGDTLTLEAPVFDLPLPADGELKTKAMIVTVDSKTDIIRIASVRLSDSCIETKRSKIAFSDLQEGMYVTATAGADIQHVESFVAVQIEQLPGNEGE